MYFTARFSAKKGYEVSAVAFRALASVRLIRVSSHESHNVVLAVRYKTGFLAASNISIQVRIASRMTKIYYGEGQYQNDNNFSTHEPTNTPFLLYRATVVRLRRFFCRRTYSGTFVLMSSRPCRSVCSTGSKH